MRSFGPHPRLETLERYLFARLEESAVEDVEIHLLICERCRQRTSDLEEERAVLRRVFSEWTGGAVEAKTKDQPSGRRETIYPKPPLAERDRL